MRRQRRSGCQRARKQGSDVKRKFAQPRSGHPINPKTEKTYRQHVGKSLGTGIADVVGPKVNTRDGLVDLQGHAEKRRLEHGYRGG